MTRRAIYLLGAAVVTFPLVSACSAAPPQPNVLALILEVSDSGVKMLSAQPARGNVTTPTVDSRIASLRRGDAMLIAYALTSTAAAAATSGRFIVSTEAIVESVDERLPGGTVRVRSRVVSVAVPYVPEATSIAFTRVEPSPRDPVDTWKRIPAGTSPLVRAPVR